MTLLRRGFVVACMTLVAVAVAACGGGSDDGLRAASESDLASTVLQTGDVPEGYERFDDPTTGLGLQHKEDQLGSPAQFGVEYELSPDVAQQGALSCIAASAFLYDTATAAETAEELGGNSLVGAGHELVATTIASNVDAYHVKSSAATYCDAYVNEPRESWTFFFVRSNVIGIVRVTYRTEGGSLAEAEAYAKKQIDNTEAALAE